MLATQSTAAIGQGAEQGVRRTATKLSAVKSKAAKPLAVLHITTERLASIPETTTPSAGSRVVSCGHTGLANLAETPAPTLIKADPHLPDDGAQAGPAAKQTSPVAEVTLGEDSEQAGSAEADLRVQSEQRAMQELLRFQKLSMQALQAANAAKPTETPTSAEGETASPSQPPSAPPVSLYANLPSEWPLARISVSMRHISVLLRVTLYRRLAERLGASSTGDWCHTGGRPRRREETPRSLTPSKGGTLVSRQVF